MEKHEFEKRFSDNSKIYQVFKVLSDMQWHCRECEYAHVQTTQIAGGGGIQGLERGNRQRPGIRIDSGNHFCGRCERNTRHDKWDGSFVAAIQQSAINPKMAQRIYNCLERRDIIENTERPLNQLTIDHKLPMIRWNEEETKKQNDYFEISDDDIIQRFQLLKKSNGSVSHNLLKSRSCETCFKTGKRGIPFGIVFFYEGDSKWRGINKKDTQGCVGCGWYDFNKWRTNLNEKIKETIK